MAAKHYYYFAVASFLSCLLVLPALAVAPGRQRSLAEINRKGPYLGLITVYSAEEEAFFAAAAFRNDSRHPFLDLSGRRFRVGTINAERVIYVRCGIGMVNAAAATQQMLDLFHIKGLIHFGVSGNINNSLSIGDVIIPKEFANTGLWDWLKPNATVPLNDVAALDAKNYNLPRVGNNSLGRIGYRSEQFYSEAGEADIAQRRVWFQVSKKWLQLATILQGMQLERCINSSLCLETEPNVVAGLRGSTANVFLDNAAYRDFLFQNFRVSSADMESSAVVMTSFSNGFPVIVFRGLSDLAGGQHGENSIDLFESLASTNVAKVVIQFINLLPTKVYRS